MVGTLMVGILMIGLWGLMPTTMGVQAIVTMELELCSEDGTPQTTLTGLSAVVVGTIITVFGIAIIVSGIGVLLGPDLASAGGP